MDENEVYLAHEGVSVKDGAPGRGSGRYALGSGDNPYQHGSGDLLSRYNKLRAEGNSDSEIAKMLGYSKMINGKEVARASDFKAAIANAKNARDIENVLQARKLRDEGKGWTEIGRIMGKSESTIRGYFKEGHLDKLQEAQKLADDIRSRIDEVGGFVDIGAGAERYLGVSRNRLDQALKQLEDEGYNIYGGRIEQVTNPGKMTTMKVIGPPGSEHSDIFDPSNINPVKDFYVEADGVKKPTKFVYPESLDSKRLEICYAEDGGTERDGVVEIRRGVEDLNFGETQKYCQVRILVDGTHYIKGMAVYADDSKFPPGVDCIFNTNKSRDKGKLGCLKEIKRDDKGNPMENPFGSAIKQGVNEASDISFDKGQSYYVGKDGKEHLSLINKRSDEGDWESWSKELPSQFLSKQSEKLIKQQLDLSKMSQKAEFDEICKLNNDAVKKNLLDSFAKDCDKSAETLKAAAFPRQRYQVILPIPSLKENEVYAPNFNDGEKVALVRFPHEGIYQIPICTVNNRNKEGKQYISANGVDAVGINSRTAERLSGADFDGDTVLAIPLSGADIHNRPQLEGLKDFDAKKAYPEREGMTYMKYQKRAVAKDGTPYMKTVDNTQKQMGMISNLITDMTLIGATDDELARATRHSQCVIDAAKHKLDYKLSEKENRIDELKKKYQGHINENGNYSTGAGTLISRASAEKSVPKRQGEPRINKETGELEYKTTTNLYYIDKAGKEKMRTEQSTQMAETKDARTLISSYNTLKEQIYADYANEMKALANEARRVMVNTPTPRANPTAKEAYAKEASSLDHKLSLALQNAPRERQAQYLASSKVNAILEDTPSLRDNKGELKKIKQRALVEAREKVGASRTVVTIEPREWEAIQMGAISGSKVMQILDHCDIDAVRELATPKAAKTLNSTQTARIASLSNRGYTNAEIAKLMHVSVSTVQKYS